MNKTFFPEAFLEKYRKLMGNEFDEFIAVSKTKWSKSIWVNSNKINPKELKKKLEEKKWKLKELNFTENGFELTESAQKPGQEIEFKNGLFNLQEKSSMLPALILNPKQNERVLDACAAPGNKSIQLNNLMQNKGNLILVEKNKERFKSLKFNVNKFNLNAETRLGDLLKASTEKKFDKILLDAPCSSEGLIRKKFDALKNWTPKLVEAKSSLQKKLILKSVDLLKPKGLLVYSTCSLSPEENEEVIDFLLKTRKIKLKEIKVNEFKLRKGIEEWNGKKFNSEVKKCIRIYPQDNNSQAFFIALIEKN
ncbi:MAG: RsmB/NOP family class I SAM-dependent RNA methyltransferase [Candidatus Diapherotrites archaeon]|nr:RsmB/NOP family class I SAM-dependent RNA methyltransferase [Candidatus Diapherotrites archaeon]